MIKLFTMRIPKEPIFFRRQGNMKTNISIRHKRFLLVLALFAVTLAGLIGYSQNPSRNKSKNALPICNCAYANTTPEKYGVIQDGKCKVIKCQLKQEKK